jgi:hypothetical protein
MHAAVDFGCNENAHLMCERSNYGLCWLQRKLWHRGHDLFHIEIGGRFRMVGFKLKPLRSDLILRPRIRNSRGQ